MHTQPTTPSTAVVPIDQIIVGERVREDYGDIPGLAASLRKYGLIQPIAVDAQNRLVVGGRRLRAARLLGWGEIATVDLGHLTADEIRERELAENNDRQGLTAAERSRALVRRARDIGPRLSGAKDSPGESLDRRGQKATTYGVPKKDVAQALGVGVGTLVEAEQHEAALGRYPEMESFEQGDALRFAKKLDRVPDDARPGIRASVRRAAETPRDLSAIRAVEQEIESSAGMQQMTLKAEYALVMEITQKKLAKVDVEEVAGLLDQDEVVIARNQIRVFRSWLDRFDAALSRGIRLIGG